MGGWGSAGLNITPYGTVLPCHAAASIPHRHLVEARLAEVEAAADPGAPTIYRRMG